MVKTAEEAVKIIRKRIEGDLPKQKSPSKKTKKAIEKKSKKKVDKKETKPKKMKIKKVAKKKTTKKVIRSKKEKKLSDQEVLTKLIKISKMQVPLQINKELRLLKEKSQYSLQELKDQLNYIEKDKEAKKKEIELKEAKEFLEKNKDAVVETKEILKEERQEQEIENYKENEINWLEDDYWNSWDKVKGHMKNLLGEGDYAGEIPKWFFLAHSKDTIRGKPQLTEGVQKKIPLIRLSIKKEKEGEETVKKQFFHTFDERFDKRYDGFLESTFPLYFYIYQVVTKDEKKYFILTQKKLPNEVCNFNGMLIEMGDYTEMSRNLKLPSISGFFILKDFEPSVKILSKEKIIEYTKKNKISEYHWLNLLARHPSGTMNNFPLEMELLRSAFILSGKVDGWPMHLGIFGPTGTNKTMGHIESISYKFEEEQRIAEGVGWTIKGLGPSFKQSIADIGYFAKAHRLGAIDEIGKMVEREINRHQVINHLLGDFNYLLEHKKRLVGSGNTGEVEVQATAKFLFATNPVGNRKTIVAHVGIIDPTFMSRIFWWVQDKEEQDFVLSADGIIRVPLKPSQDYLKDLESPPTTLTNTYLLEKSKKLLEKGKNLLEKRKKGIVLGKLWGKVYERDDFLTLFDTCYDFTCKIDDVEVNRLIDIVTSFAKEPMKSTVWKPRAYHHVKLLIDGLCKHRCLFKDYDVLFKANQEDYDAAERILVRMVNGWETNLQPKEEVYDTR